MEKVSARIKSSIDGWCDDSEFRSPYLTGALMTDVLAPFQKDKNLAILSSFELEFASEIQVNWIAII